eukprot:3178688-Rhodomonas_salina.3
MYRIRVNSDSMHRIRVDSHGRVEDQLIVQIRVEVGCRPAGPGACGQHPPCSAGAPPPTTCRAGERRREEEGGGGRRREEEGGGERRRGWREGE